MPADRNGPFSGNKPVAQRAPGPPGPAFAGTARTVQLRGNPTGIAKPGPPPPAFAGKPGAVQLRAAPAPLAPRGAQPQRPGPPGLVVQRALAGPSARVIQRADEQVGIKVVGKYAEVIEPARETAIAYLRDAIDDLSGEEVSEEARQLFEALYVTSGFAERQEVVDRMRKTLDGLVQGKFAVDTRGFFNVVSKAKSGIIFIAMAQAKESYSAIRYLIHEASHVFAATDDAAGYFYDKGYEKGKPKTAKDAINNADSLAVFVVLRKGLKLK